MNSFGVFRLENFLLDPPYSPTCVSNPVNPVNQVSTYGQSASAGGKKKETRFLLSFMVQWKKIVNSMKVTAFTSHLFPFVRLDFFYVSLDGRLRHLESETGKKKQE